MSDDQTSAYYGVVRVPGVGALSGVYDIVRHEPGFADYVMARGLYPDCVAIAAALNRETNRRGGDDGRAA
jgi:hypothetical protein